MKLRLLLLFISFAFISQLFANSDNYNLKIVSAYCKVSEYNKILNSSQTELKEFFDNDETYKIEDQKFGLKKLHFSLILKMGEITEAKVIQESAEDKLAKYKNSMELAGDIGYKLKAYLFKDVPHCYLNFNYSDIDGFVEDGQGKHSKLLPTCKVMSFNDVVFFEKFGKYVIFKAEILDFKYSKHSDIMQIWAIQLNKFEL